MTLLLGVAEPGGGRGFIDEECRRVWAADAFIEDAVEDDDGGGGGGGRAAAVVATRVEMSRCKLRCARARAAGDRAAAAAAVLVLVLVALLLFTPPCWAAAEVALLVRPETLPVPLLTLRLPLSVRCCRTCRGTSFDSECDAERAAAVTLEAAVEEAAEALKRPGSMEDSRRPLR